MTLVNEIVNYNKKFVEDKKYEKFQVEKFPRKKVAVLACMDNRLTELLPAAMGLKNGDGIIIKNAGAIIPQPFDSIMRSLIIAIYELGVEEIIVVGHTDCGSEHLIPENTMNKILKSGIPKEKIEKFSSSGLDLNEWLKGAQDVKNSVIKTYNIIKNHVLLPSHIIINSFVMDSSTGLLTRVEDF